MNHLRIAAEFAFGSALVAGAGASPIYIADDQGNLGTITTAGVYTNIGVTRFPGGPPIVLGDLAVNTAGALYGTSWNGSATDLYSIDTSTGALTLIGPTGAGPQATYALTFSAGGVLYGDDDTGLGDNLVTINTSTGAETVVGPLGPKFVPDDLVFNALGTAMYTVGGFGNNFGTVDPNTGATTIVGPTSAPAAGLVYTAGTLYAFGSDNHVYSVGTSTGAATDLGAITGTPAGWGQAWGAAMAPAAVPEPFTLTVLAGGLGLLFARRRKSKQA